MNGCQNFGGSCLHLEDQAVQEDPWDCFTLKIKVLLPSKRPYIFTQIHSLTPQNTRNLNNPTVKTPNSAKFYTPAEISPCVPQASRAESYSELQAWYYELQP
jgi:hypothetical protein